MVGSEKPSNQIKSNQIKSNHFSHTTQHTAREKKRKRAKKKFEFEEQKTKKHTVWQRFAEEERETKN